MQMIGLVTSGRHVYANSPLLQSVGRNNHSCRLGVCWPAKAVTEDTESASERWVFWTWVCKMLRDNLCSGTVYERAGGLERLS